MVALPNDAGKGTHANNVERLGSRAGWGSAPRETLNQAQRYSRFVRVMKAVLPLTAAVLAAAVLAYVIQPSDSKYVGLTFERMKIIENDLTMVHPRLSGIDQDGQPYVVTADTAVQDKTDPHRARLKQVDADVTLKSGTWLNVTANTGDVDNDRHTLDLNGNINIFADNGYEAHTSAATVNLKSGLVHGSSHVDGQGPLGTLSADTFEIHRDTKQLFFTGNVKSVLYRSGKKTK